jgi:hypothetical protein
MPRSDRGRVMHSTDPARRASAAPEPGGRCDAWAWETAHKKRGPPGCLSDRFIAHGFTGSRQAITLHPATKRRSVSWKANLTSFRRSRASGFPRILHPGITSFQGSTSSDESDGMGSHVGLGAIAVQS